LIGLSEHCEGLAQEAVDANRRLESLRSQLNTGNALRGDDRKQAEADFAALVKDVPRLRMRAQAEARVLASCKSWLASLPHSSKLESCVVIADGVELAGVRKRLREIEAEVRLIEAAPSPSADIADRIKSCVAELSRKASPIFYRGLSGGHLDVRWPASVHSNRANANGFDTELGMNALLMAAYLHPEALIERLLKEVEALASQPIPVADRPEALRRLADEALILRNQEEVLVTRALADGDEVVARDVSAPARCVLGCRVIAVEERPVEAVA
jgi:hypothetical protein